MLNKITPLAAIQQAATSFGELPPRSYEEDLQRQADSLNAVPGSLKWYDCPDCLNRGYSYTVDDRYLVARDCGCMVHRRNNRNLENSGLDGIIEECTFASFRTSEPWQENARRRAEDYTQDNYGKWFCALGAVGSGKTHLCTAICGHFLRKGFGVAYMKWRYDSVKIKGEANNPEAYAKLIGPFKNSKVLYIDDFFKTEKGIKPTTADINLAFELLNHRYINKHLITIISSELFIADLLAIDEAVGSRIYQRSKGNVVEFKGKDKNWRLKA